MKGTAQHAAPTVGTGAVSAGNAAPGASPGLPLWPLALLAGLVPAVAALLALAVSVQQQWVPLCNPFVDGCTSISRAARQGLANHLFRALMLPAATLQGLVWLLAAHWLQGALGPRRGLRWMAALGVLAAAALVLYATFLGTEGAAYRLLRQYGTVLYFGNTCLCMLLLGQAVQALQVLQRQQQQQQLQLQQQRQAQTQQSEEPGRPLQPQGPGHSPLPTWLVRSHVALACTLVALGVVNAIVAALLSPEWKARTENVTEWWGALIFVLGFCALAVMWARCGLRGALRAG